jgi:glycosyltransferase involved in cell wall biosynthesis
MPAERSPVTIGIPTRNRASYLRLTVESVLEQTHADVRIIVADNASTDETPSVMTELRRRDARVTGFRHEVNTGMTGNWNSLLAAAEPGLFILLSDDDLLEPTAVAELSEVMRDPSVAFAYCSVSVIDALGRVVGMSKPGPARESGDDFIRASLRQQRDVLPSAVMFRIRRERRLPYPDIGTACDHVHRLTLALSGDVACIPRPLVRYRKHASNESLSHRAAIDSALETSRFIRESHGRLSAFTAEAERFAVANVRMHVVAASSNGRKESARYALGVLERLHAVRWRDRAAAAFFGSRLGRSIAKARRALNAARARSQLR